MIRAYAKQCDHSKRRFQISLLELCALTWTAAFFVCMNFVPTAGKISVSDEGIWEESRRLAYGWPWQAHVFFCYDGDQPHPGWMHFWVTDNAILDVAVCGLACLAVWLFIRIATRRYKRKCTTVACV